MSKASDFVKRGKRTLRESTEKSINDLLAVLDSKIEYPIDKYGNVNETRLLAVVKSRGQAYNSAVKLSDEIELDRSSDLNLKRKFINGLCTTFNEMDKILLRDIRSDYQIDIADEADEVLNDIFKSNNVTDDYISILSKTKEEAYLLNKQILDRISLLDDPDKINKEKLENIKATSIAEIYADE